MACIRWASNQAANGNGGRAWTGSRSSVGCDIYRSGFFGLLPPRDCSRSTATLFRASIWPLRANGHGSVPRPFYSVLWHSRLRLPKHLISQSDSARLCGRRDRLASCASRSIRKSTRLGGAQPFRRTGRPQRRSSRTYSFTTLARHPLPFGQRASSARACRLHFHYLRSSLWQTLPGAEFTVPTMLLGRAGMHPFGLCSWSSVGWSRRASFCPS